MGVSPRPDRRGCSPGFDLDRARIESKSPLAREGLPFLAIAGGLAAGFWYLGWTALFVFSLALFLFVAYFFRDPRRTPSGEPNAVYTPADGTVLQVSEPPANANPLGGPAVKVSVFMSVFSVHVNRAPFSGRIGSVLYRPGKFFSAHLDKASEQNEQNTITLDTPDRRKIVFTQIAGLIARRIVCWVQQGDEVEAGQRFGLIRFGSRVDLYLPGDTRVVVKPRQKVKAGQTVIGYLS